MHGWACETRRFRVIFLPFSFFCFSNPKPPKRSLVWFRSRPLLVVAFLLEREEGERAHGEIKSWHGLFFSVNWIKMKAGKKNGDVKRSFGTTHLLPR